MEAAEWFIELKGTATREQHEAFADWLRRSPVHVEEFLQLTALEGDLARLPQLKDVEVGSLVAQGAQAPLPQNIVPWERLHPLVNGKDQQSAEDRRRSAS